MTDLTRRKVKIFRCYRDPQIPPKAKNAFAVGTGMDQLNAEVEFQTQGLYVKILGGAGIGREFFIGFANIENVEFFPEADVLPLRTAVTKGKGKESVIPTTPFGA